MIVQCYGFHYDDDPPQPGSLWFNRSTDKTRASYDPWNARSPCSRAEDGRIISEAVIDESFDMSLLLVMCTKQPDDKSAKHSWAITQVMDRRGRICWVESSWFEGRGVYEKIT